MSDRAQTDRMTARLIEALPACDGGRHWAEARGVHAVATYAGVAAAPGGHGFHVVWLAKSPGARVLDIVHAVAAGEDLPGYVSSVGKREGLKALGIARPIAGRFGEAIAARGVIEPVEVRLDTTGRQIALQFLLRQVRRGLLRHGGLSLSGDGPVLDALLIAATMAAAVREVRRSKAATEAARGSDDSPRETLREAMAALRTATGLLEAFVSHLDQEAAR